MFIWGHFLDTKKSQNFELLNCLNNLIYYLINYCYFYKFVGQWFINFCLSVSYSRVINHLNMGDANSISECFAYLLIFFCTQVLQSCVSFRYFGIVASNQYVWVTCSVLQIWRCGSIIKVCNRLNSNKLCTSKIKSSTKGAIVITVSTYLIFIYLLIHYIIWYTCDSCNSTTLYGNIRFRMLSP